MSNEAMWDKLADQFCGVPSGGALYVNNWPIRKYTPPISRFQAISETSNQSKHRNQRANTIGLSPSFSNLERRSGRIGGESPIST